MSHIKSRKHARPQFNQTLTAAAIAAVMLPALAQAADTTLPEVKVTSKQENDFKADKASSPKYTQPLVDTPQTITVIKRELIEQQGAVTLTQALQNTPGVGAFFLGENGSTNTGDAVYMRGFDSSSSIYVDGVRDLGSISRDLFNIEQIDVLKGAAGTDSVRSAPTGSINLVSKQAQKDDATYGSVKFGSGSQKRVTADWNKVINAETGTAFRLNVMDEDSGSASRNEVKNKRWGVAPSLAFGLGSPTRIYLNYLHVDQNNVPDGGVPTIGLPGYSSPDPKRPFLSTAPMVDPKNFYGSASDFDKVKADMLTGRIEHDFNPKAKLINTTRYGKTSQNYLLTAFMGSTANLVTPSASDKSTWTLARSIRTLKDQKNEILTNQTNLLLDFDTKGLQHTVLTGVELTNEKQNTFGYSGTGTLPAANFYNPNPNDPVSGLNLVRNGVFTRGATTTVSAYAFDTLKFNPQWQLSGGVRIDHYSTDYSATSLSTLAANPTLPVNTLIPTNLNMDGNLVNWKVGGLYKPTEASSVYVSYATSKQPPGGSNFALSASASSAANPKFDPQETKNAEIGTKWDLLDQKLSFTAALYRTEVSNEVEQNLVDLLYYQTGKKRVQGVELGVTGAITKTWLVSAGYTKMDTKVESGKITTASGINNLAYTPKQAFTAWTSYELPFGVKLGGGARFVDSLLRGTDGAVGTPAYTNSYWVVDAMASYAINKNIDLQLNMYNLGDKAYVAAINKSGYRYTPGTPRSATLMANIKF
ncbi:catecholate siderophore receptor Fiu [Undibacterium sp. RTI2.1]|uniref:catecholate siderophore receptor Fiu n=1 Tax=unclassified Undibacterium TaxID=2630295 RepID=UPI002B224E8A|nr:MULTISPECIES: catecholate siderophore receptor Fiu [unclassified Undibacterium]MEB0031048.1 catecholate siderophore receptor Fiu [Undibacterium sp. RTI2.1]MEB0116265.1 catecholate siderophore receptor Fiu [Undibacterium sp. RTI2.2]